MPPKLSRRLIQAEENIIALQVNNSTNAVKIAEEAKIRWDHVSKLASRADKQNEHLCELEDALEDSVNKLSTRLAALEAKLAERTETQLAPSEPEIPKGWKRTTKEGAARDGNGFYHGFWRLPDGEWSSRDWWCDWWSNTLTQRERIYLARDYPELPADVAAAGWVACEWGEATEMGNGNRAGYWHKADYPTSVRWWGSNETDITWVKLEPKK